MGADRQSQVIIVEDGAVFSFARVCEDHVCPVKDLAHPKLLREFDSVGRQASISASKGLCGAIHLVLQCCACQ